LGEDQGGYLAALQGGLMLGLKCRFILEKEKVGGICINVGCIPTKYLLHQTEIFMS